MKNLIIIDNYHDVIPDKRLKGFNKVLKPMKNHLNFEFVYFEKLNELNTYNKVLNADGIILSGSHLFLSDSDTVKIMELVMKLIDDFKKPILGICLGHQLIGAKFGFKIVYLEFPYLGKQNQRILTLKLNQQVDLINSDTITVEMDHQQEIKYTPEFDNIFDIIASSDSCKLQIIKHKKRPIYGVQFHPETIADVKAIKEGNDLILNFIEMI